MLNNKIIYVYYILNAQVFQMDSTSFYNYQTWSLNSEELKSALDGSTQQ
jgi:hypothetical protein